MAKVETMGVLVGGGDAVGMSGAIRGVARPAMFAVGTEFEGRA